MENALFHPSGAQNVAAAPKFSENKCIPRLLEAI
jgi:hypothetical protein